ncbi:MAG: phosphonate transport system substrate-binding protein [Glaciecola sp.]|jgi:phosphonate transport system substrate-binding protein
MNSQTYHLIKQGIRMSRTLFFIALLISLPHTGLTQTKTLTFAIVPQQSAERLATLWTPILQYVSQHSELNIVFSTAKDIPTFELRLANGEYDIAYMNPYHYVVFSKSVGYKAIAKQQDKTIRGVIVAKANGSIKSINDLEGARLAFPAPAAFAASILPRAELKKNGISFTPVYVSSHDSVYLNVSKGFFPAGGGIQRTLNNIHEDVKIQLTTIWQTNEYTPHAFATHPQVDQTTRQKLLAALMSLNTNEQGQALLKAINFKGIEAAVHDDWDDVRALELETLLGASEQNQ